MSEIAPAPAEHWLWPATAESKQTNADYVAPRIESFLTADQIEREIAYAGAYTPGPWTNIPD